MGMTFNEDSGKALGIALGAKGELTLSRPIDFAKEGLRYSFEVKGTWVYLKPCKGNSEARPSLRTWQLERAIARNEVAFH